MNYFLLQVQGKTYDDIWNKRRYENMRWEQKYKPYNDDHGTVKSGDRLLVYCGSKVSNKDHRQKLAFSVDVISVINDRTTFELGDPQEFSCPLTDIHKHIKQDKLDDVFGNCGKQGFNIAKLEPTAVEQILNLVNPSSFKPDINGESPSCPKTGSDDVKPFEDKAARVVGIGSGLCAGAATGAAVTAPGAFAVPGMGMGVAVGAAGAAALPAAVSAAVIGVGIGGSVYLGVKYGPKAARAAQKHGLKAVRAGWREFKAGFDEGRGRRE